MQPVKLLETTAIHFYNIDGLDGVFVPLLVEHIAKKYMFFEYPRTSEGIVLKNDLKFLNGRKEDRNIAKIDFYRGGLVVQEIMDTYFLDEILDDLVTDLEKNFNLKFTRSAPVSHAYVSTVEFQASPNFATTLQKISSVADLLNQMVRALGCTVDGFTLNTFSLLSDPSKTLPIAVGKFLVERRAERPFQENIFYSEAPVSTREHVMLIERLESLF